MKTERLAYWLGFLRVPDVAVVGVRGMAFLLLAVVFSVGCAETRHAMSVDKSGFLGEALYEKLTPGDPSIGEASLRWVDNSAKGQKESKVILDPVVLYRQPHDVKKEGNPNQDVQELINYFHSKIYEALSKHFEIVNKPGPQTYRVQVALTAYEERWVALDMISTAIPQMYLVSELKALITDKPSFVGQAQAEAKISESLTGRVVAAAIDRRVGGKTWGKGTSSWADVQHAMDYWALQIGYRVCVVSGKTGCGEVPKP